MADTSFGVTPGSGANLHTVTTSIGGTTVNDQVIKVGDPYLATYSIKTAPAVSVATLDSHTLQIMAGASLNVYLRRLRITQLALATATAIGTWQIRRLTTAGTGGSSLSATAYDSTDAAAGATGMQLPTSKGTEGDLLDIFTVQYVQTAATGGPGASPILYEYEWNWPQGKAIRIPAGTSNGLVVKNGASVPAATVYVDAVIVEANF